jgi:hypothetical protein
MTITKMEAQVLLALLDRETPGLFTVGIVEKLEAIVNGEPTKNARNSDPTTSKQGAVSSAFRAGSQKDLLLREYRSHLIFGLTDEEAGKASGLAYKNKCCYWKRCSELREAGLIRANGETRLSTASEQQMVCVITPKGIELLEKG